jgi:DNA (cytosine-5)-methyltransferase 1
MHPPAIAQTIVAMRESGFGYWMEDTVAGTLDANMGMSGHANRPAVMTQSMAVRRLTPTECERLQGFPDGYTDIMPKGKPTPDGPRYKALGNSWAVPVVRWIGERIANEIA